MRAVARRDRGVTWRPDAIASGELLFAPRGLRTGTTRTMRVEPTPEQRPIATRRLTWKAESP